MVLEVMLEAVTVPPKEAAPETDIVPVTQRPSVPIVHPAKAKLVPPSTPKLPPANSSAPVPLSSEINAANCAEVVAAKTLRLFALSATVLPSEISDRARATLEHVPAPVCFRKPTPDKAAMQSRSASHASTLVPMANPRFVLTVLALEKSDPLLVVLTQSVHP